MSVAIVPSVESQRFALPPEPVLPLSVDQYHAMIRAGALESGAPIELLEGWLVSKMTKSPLHELSAGCSLDALTAIVGSGWHVRMESPITTADSEPEPDVSVVRGYRRDFVHRHPGPEDVGLIVEVADTSLDRDRRWKQRIYAAAGIPVYWIVNLIDRQVEVFSQPSGVSEHPEYAACQIYRDADQIPVVLEGAEAGRIAVSGLLP
ncbi:MAG: Uma2 family endonuclease [Pirellulaceae bacterium]|nr:Uma2 family endonuclease [Pirellulaceae bacterium]